jgi:hypothetical protein
MKRGAQRTGLMNCFGLLGKNNSDQSQADVHTVNGTNILNGANGNSSIETIDHHDGGALEDLKGKTKKDIEQDKLEQYFEALDETRKRHHKVQTDVLEVWFM